VVERKYTYCSICEATCGLAADVENNRILELAPDPDHVVSRGYACAKGLYQHEIVHSPDRITTPLKRVGDSFHPISWEQAWREIGGKLRTLIDAYGGDSIATYLGNPLSFNFFAPIFAAGFSEGVGSRNFFQTGSQDCNNKFVVAQRMYGFPFLQPFPDVDRTDCLIVVGSNPAVSRMSFIHLPNPAARLSAIEKRGGRVVFVDPRRIESAKSFGEHVFIRPDTDVFFYLAFLNEVLARGAHDEHHIAVHMRGFETLRAIALPFTPERCAAVTGIAASVLRGLVDSYVEADGAALFCSTGVNQGSNGTIAFWLQESINAITGNLDRVGGTLVGHGLVPALPRHLRRAGKPMRTDRSRIGNLPSCVDSLPAGILADEILTGGKGQVRALVVLAGNPLLSVPNGGGKLETALRSLELLVSIDIVRNETGNLAHYVLPGLHALERPNIPFAFQSLMGATPIPFVQYTDAVVRPSHQQKDELEILIELARASRTALFGSRAFQRAMETWLDARHLPLLGSKLGFSHERLDDLVLRATRSGSVRGLRRWPHGRLRSPATAGDFLSRRVVTDDGKVDLAPSDIVALTARLEPRFAWELRHRLELKMVGRREPLSHNSWMHNIERFVRGRRQTNYLYIHPEDAHARGLEDGDVARVSTEAGAVEMPVRLTTDMMPGAVALPHGWGHQSADGLRVARTTRGANKNLLIKASPDALEPLSGMAHFNGPLVTLERAEGSRAGGSGARLSAEGRDTLGTPVLDSLDRGSIVEGSGAGAESRSGAPAR
jgi:anaerobic selenocysteine-containing dehydrogenase